MKCKTRDSTRRFRFILKPRKPVNRGLIKGQSILEYVVLICVILTALLIMHVFIKRGYMGRLKEESETLGQQYSPRHTEILVDTARVLYSVSFTGGHTSKEDIQFGELGDLVPDNVKVPDGMTVDFSFSDSDFSRQEEVDSLATEPPLFGE